MSLTNMFHLFFWCCWRWWIWTDIIWWCCWWTYRICYWWIDSYLSKFLKVICLIFLIVLSYNQWEKKYIKSIAFGLELNLKIWLKHIWASSTQIQGWAQISFSHETSNPPSVCQIGRLEKINPHPSANSGEADWAD